MSFLAQYGGIKHTDNSVGGTFMTRLLGSIDRSGFLPSIEPPIILIYSNHLMDLDGIVKLTVVVCPSYAGLFPS